MTVSQGPVHTSAKLTASTDFGRKSDTSADATPEIGVLKQLRLEAAPYLPLLRPPLRAGPS